MKKLFSLVIFSLKRKIFNKTFLLLNLMIILIITVFLFLDFIILPFFPSLNAKTKIYVQDEFALLESIQGLINEKYEIVWGQNFQNQKEELISSKSIYVDYRFENNELIFQIHSQDKLSLNHQLFINALFAKNNLEYFYKQDQQIKIEYVLAFYLLTMMYFIALGYLSALSSEIILEKSMKVLEIIVTFSSSKIHLLSKVISNWLTLFSQLFIIVSSFAMLVLLRLRFDDAKRLITLYDKLGIIIDIESISSLLQQLKINQELLLKVGMGLFFLVLHLTMVQLILAIICSLVKNVEQANLINAPCYLALMGLYYLALYFNNETIINSIYCKLLSYLPIISILIMPLRIIVGNCTLVEMICCLWIDILIIIFIIKKGILYYHHGILKIPLPQSF